MSNNTNAPQHIREFSESLGSVKLTIGPQAPQHEAEVEAQRLANTCPVDMVNQVVRRIEQIEQRLADVASRDRVTGEPVYRVPEGGSARRALEIELHQLKTNTLPMTRQRAAEVAAAKATLPTADDLAIVQIERRERIASRALELVEELEAKEQAERLLAERKRIRLLG